MTGHPFQSPEYFQHLRQLQEVDFVLVELNLYLDTHPDDAQAIQQFNHYVSERTKLAQAYQERYGPLQNFGRDYSGTPFTWVNTPWPWQV
ncbi:spore coat protein CotJB [Paenibacillus sp. ACRRX]|uniref:spore coat protein CotJB n=1 Tax=Paenibacillus sp. ACRRX TaxID=2918206 RepID=UPI001EF6A6B4|nr:spore coat protein CotJB [Paenibacillus sp. ACRRX]MCG7406977.1 spore coat protein CotJB [Paenibacillus sp. ACRRX]